MSDIQLITIHNPFNRQEREIKKIPDGQTLWEIREKNLPREVRFVVSINGQIIPDDQLTVISPRKGDCVVCVPYIEDGNGKGILMAVMMIAIAVAAPYAIAAMAPAGGLLVTTTGTLTGLGMAAAAGMTLAGGLLINTLMPGISPKTPTMDDLGFDASQSYSWSPHTIQQQGTAVPRAYGKNKLYGNIINSHIEYKEDKQYLYLLIGLGIGPYKSINGKNIKLQDQKKNRFNNIQTNTRRGFIDQEVIPNFRNSWVDESNINVRVKNGSPYTHTTTEDSFDKLIVTIGFLSGLVKVDDKDGDRDWHTVDIRIQIRRQGDAWEDGVDIAKQIPKDDNDELITETVTVASSKWYLVRRWGKKKVIINLVEYDREVYEVNQTGSGNKDDHSDGDEVLVGYEVFQWQWFKKNEVFEKATPVNKKTLGSNKIKPIYFNFDQDIPDDKKGTYDIKITRFTDNHDGSQEYFDASYLTQVSMITKSRLKYPRNALVGLKVLATDQISGTLRFSCIAKCAYIRVYTGTYPNGTWYIRYSKNPAWVAWDIATQPVIIGDETAGLSIERYDGFDPSRLDLEKFKEWADYCDETVYDGKTVRYTTSGCTDTSIVLADGGSDFDEDDEGEFPEVLIDPAGGTNYETVSVTAVSGNTLTVSPALSQAPGSNVAVKKGEKRISFNGVFDTESSMWDALLKVCQVGRTVPVWNGTKLTVAIDKPASPVQLISVGNIGQDSFEEHFLSAEERISEVEVDFVDSEKDYERNRITVYNKDVNDGNNKATIELFGVTKESEAWRAGMLKLYKNQCHKRSVNVDLDIDSIGFTIGDVINVQHDVPKWGEGGRIVSATSNTVTLDKTVTIEADKSYNIMIRLSNDTVVEKSVTNTPGSYTILNVSSAFSQVPVPLDVYAFGEVNKVVKPFRVVDMSRTHEQRCTPMLVEYNATVYNADTDDQAIKTSNYSSLETVPTVKNLTLKDHGFIDHSGNTRYSILVVFDLPETNILKSVKIYYSEYYDDSVLTSSDYRIADSDMIHDVKPDTPYKIVVVSEDLWGNKSDFEDSPSKTITIKRTPNIPEIDMIVTGLHIFSRGNDTNFSGRDCKFVWDQIAVTDRKSVAGKEIFGAGTERPRSWFKGYTVEIWGVTGTEKLPRRTEFVQSNEYTYTYEKNYEDGLVRDYEIRVRAKDKFNRLSKRPTILRVSNPAPAMKNSSGVTITPTLRKIKNGHRAVWPHPYRLNSANQYVPEYDITQFIIKYATDAALTQNVKRVKVKSQETEYSTDPDDTVATYKVEIDGLDPNTDYYYEVIPFDAYGKGTASNIASGKPGLTHDDDEQDKARPARFDFNNITITPDVEINDDGKTVTNLIVKGEKASEADVDGYILEARFVKDVDAASPPTGAEIDAGITGGGKKCEGNTYMIGIDGEAGTGTTDTNYWKKKIPDVKNNWKGFFRIRKQNTSGQKGPWSSESPGQWVSFVTTKANSAADTTAPGTPTLSVSAKTESIELTASLATPPADLAGFRFAVKANSDFSGDETTYLHASIDATDGKAKVTFFGTPGTTYYIRAQSYDNSKNYSSWSASQSTSPASVTVSELSEPYSLWKYKGKVTSSANNKASWTGGSGNELVKKRNSGTTQNYTITARTNQTVTGTMYLVFDKDTSTTEFYLKTAAQLDAIDKPVVIAKVVQTSGAKCNIIKYLDNEKFAISAFQGGFNNLSALFLDVDDATLGSLIMKHNSGTSLKMEDSSGNVAIRMRVNDSSEPDFVIMKSGYDADNASDAEDPNKVAFSSKLAINGSAVRPNIPMLVETGGPATLNFAQITSGNGYNARTKTTQYQYMVSYSGTAKRKITADLSTPGGITIPLPYRNVIQQYSDGEVYEEFYIVHNPSDVSESNRVYLMRFICNNSGTNTTIPARNSDQVIWRLEAETFT